MERYEERRAVIDAFRNASPGSPFLSKLLPLLNNPESIPHAQLLAVGREGFQLRINSGSEQQPKYAQLFLTLSRASLSLTVATDYNNGNRFDPLTRSTLVIERGKHIDYVTHKTNGTLRGIFFNEEAIEKFTPELKRTMEPLGLQRFSR